MNTLRCLAVAACVAATALAQRAPRSLLDQVIAKVEQNYAGFHLEVAPVEERRSRYEAFKEKLQRQADAADDSECLRLLREYVAWFDDGHLFVQEYPSHTEEELAQFRRSTPLLDTDGLAAALRARVGELAPIEGLWYTPEHEIAVTASANGFVGVILETRAETWRSGQVLAEFVARPDGTYAATLRQADHSPRTFEATLCHGLLLHMPPHTWGRRFPVAEPDRDVLDPVDPRAPRLRVLEDACVLTLPSLSPHHQPALRKLCSESREAILARDLLIIDLRGNEGGSSTVARALAPFYQADDPRPTTRTDRPHVLSSADSRSYYERMKSGFFTPAWLRSLRRRLGENPGKLVPVFEDGEEPPPFVARRRHDRPAHVAILMDGKVVSAGEAFVLDAMQHRKVRTFGSNTGGMIDYQNVLMVAVRHDRHGFILGFPLIAASERLPEGALNRTGIPPNVPIGTDDPNPIATIRAHYRRD